MKRTNNLVLAAACLAGCVLVGGSAFAEPTKPPAAAKKASGKVARIGFIDLERCCACRRW